MTTPETLPTICTLWLPGFEIRIVRHTSRGSTKFVALLALWRRRIDGRRTIRAMTSEQIKELDLDRTALHREAEKPFWRA